MDTVTIVGFCQLCEKQVSGISIRVFPHSQSRAHLVKSDDGRIHKVVEGVTQTILTDKQLEAISKRVRRRREFADILDADRALDERVERDAKNWVLAHWNKETEAANKEAS